MLVILTASLLGCATFTKTSLYFGLSRPDGGVVTEAEFQAFLDASVSPYIQGYTIYEARGVWVGDSEDSRVLEVIYQRSGNDSEDLDEIARRYCDQFHQQAVLRVDDRVRVSLTEGAGAADNLEGKAQE